ncbi:hypothetical protein KAFR_0G01910 [Kazachstania africana CBS 2517]|uniref:Replication factor C subunit 1 n=1 Tax=Kazachstania africana (strain ATCC 22294 / BCRC 22015 / CBS 2517 / CECT 1963 / NBRC 1671 / NRRL Y-8276) TaxID=1071382 RepID=H2AXX5_KAZAF|nr:hypothetical protein KAFR_0G01910 [Kazachstania africana CBS 2517]CCF59225.1 hypothetical protein KAFR_0G01910 [Kazachstania africana CBS 2517]
MVDITDFFNKSKKKPTSAPKPSAVKEKSKEVIDLDDDDDDDDSLLEIKPAKPRRAPPKRSMTEPIVKKEEVKTEAEPQPKAVKRRIAESNKVDAPVKKAKTEGGTTAQDVLNSIPSLDLSTVHVKEDIKFDFRKSGGPSSSDASADMPMDFPEGASNCLLGLTIVFTGVLPNLERGAVEAVAKRYGAKVTKSISSRTSVVVLGDDAGPKKLEKIKQLKIKAIDEDGFKQLISGMPEEGGEGEAAEKARKKREEEEAKALKEAQDLIKQENIRKQTMSMAQKSGEYIKNEDKIRDEDKLWTVKYAPTNLNQMCGNKSSILKLKNWLLNWNMNKKSGFKNPGRDGSGVFRSAMLYGPPGIGKTTAAHLIAKELGYDILEQNASDVRSKSLLNAGVKNALDNMSVIGYFKHKDEIEESNGKNFVVIMDEVDGMSGGDRGGVGQLAQFCRKTSTPMILICNERNLPKMRPFDRTCLDLQFRRPDANSIKSRLMTIAIREGFKLDPNVIDRLVQATRGDIRQIINLLSTISTTTKSINHENIKQISDSWQKNIALKPFDITHKLLDGHIYNEVGSNTFTLNDKIALYFDDLDFTPLMIQENYINSKPGNLSPGETHLQAVAEAADSISQGDLVERKIRSAEQLWSLLPLHAVLSSVRPASKVAGHMTGRINFTTWLGQNSKTNKYYRLLQELQYHTKLRTSADKASLRLEYLPILKKRLLSPLLKEGVDSIPSIIELMDDYYLTKEDWDTIMEFMVGPERTDALIKKIPSSVKSAFTRKYNGMTHPVAIYRAGVTVGSGGAAQQGTPDFEDVVDADTAAAPPDDEDNNKEDDDLKKDKLIKQKARPGKRKPASGKATGGKKRKVKA